MKLTYIEKQLYYDFKDINEVKKFIKKMIKKYGPLDRAHLTISMVRGYDKVTGVIWPENWVPQNYNATKDLEELKDTDDVFFSFKSESQPRKFDIFFTKRINNP
jgi:hypothetical protein